MTTKHAPDTYKTLLDNLSDGVMVVDADGTVQIANPALCHMFGLEPDEVVGRLFAEIFVTIEGFDEFVQIVLDAVSDQSDIKRRIAAVRIGAQNRSLSVTTSHLKTNHARQAGVIAVAVDITEIKELRDTELRMAKVVEEQYSELQTAYRDIETRNETLSVMMRKVQAARGLAALLVVGLFVAIGGWYVQPLEVAETDTPLQLQFADDATDFQASPTQVVEASEFRSTISVRGTLVPGRVVKLVSPFETHISEVYVKHGQRVDEGDSLVDLDSGKLMVEYRRAQVEYIQARDKLVEIENWENSGDMARARRALRRTKIALDEAELNLKRTVFLFEEGIVSASEHEVAQQRHQERQLDFQEAERELGAVQEKADEDAKRVARLEVENAQGRLREEQEKLDRVALKAPISGVIVAEGDSAGKPLARGRPAPQGELLLSIADFEHISVISSVNEVDVGKLEPGQRAMITGPGFPDLEIEGAVAQVSARGLGGPRQRGTPQFEITIDLDRLDAVAREQLRVGMSAYVTIVIHSNPDALLVPLTAVEQSGGKTWLRVIDRNTDAVERRAVTLGFTTLDSVEVAAGLAAGEEILVSQR